MNELCNNIQTYFMFLLFYVKNIRSRSQVGLESFERTFRETFRKALRNTFWAAFKGQTPRALSAPPAKRMNTLTELTVSNGRINRLE